MATSSKSPGTGASKNFRPNTLTVVNKATQVNTTPPQTAANQQMRKRTRPTGSVGRALFSICSAMNDAAVRQQQPLLLRVLVDHGLGVTQERRTINTDFLHFSKPAVIDRLSGFLHTVTLGHGDRVELVLLL